MQLFMQNQRESTKTKAFLAEIAIV